MAITFCKWRNVLQPQRFLRAMPNVRDKSIVEEVIFSERLKRDEHDDSLGQSLSSGPIKLFLDKEIEEKLNDGVLKAKHHYGLRNHKVVKVPEEIETAIFSLTGKYKLEDLSRASNTFVHNLKSRLPPVNTDELRSKAAVIEDHLRCKSEVDSSNLTQEEIEMYENKIKRELFARLRKAFYHWKPIEYDAYNCILYMFSRFAAEYAIMTKVFEEIREQNADFRPEYLLDVGSGLCSVLWATRSAWNDGVRVALCIDPSPDMIKISKLLMQGGHANGKRAFEGVFFKPVIPYGEQEKYDLVTSAFTLLDLESQDDRIKLYHSMLLKSRKYIVIVENATVGGFKLIMEARDFFIAQENVQILAPCSHMHSCPRLKSQEVSPICGFSASHALLRLITQKEKIVKEQFSYLIVERTPLEHEENKMLASLHQKDWPRVLHSAPRARHVHIHACCPDGNIRQIPITKNKNGRHLYKCATYCKSGDLLPCTLDMLETTEKSGN